VDIKGKIKDAFENATTRGRGHFMQYLVASGLRELTEAVQDF
jgi:hypothetical protein